MMTSDSSTYLPISCEFHDLLETLATMHKPAQISFRDAAGLVRHRETAIADVFAKHGAEYLAMDEGETLRLDQLIAVDGEQLADYCAKSA